MLGGKTLPRRDFLRHAVMLAGAGVTAPLWAAMKYNRDAATRYFREQASETDARVNAAPSLNYWCTWSMQGMTRRLPEWRRKVAAIVGETGIAGAGYAGNYIFDELVYGPKGWSKTMFPNSRKHLYMMLDSGWDVPYGADCPSRFSMNTLTDEWHYQKGDGWVSAAWGRDVRQVAPADIHSAPGTLVSTRLQSQARQ